MHAAGAEYDYILEALHELNQEFQLIILMYFCQSGDS